MIDGLFFFSNGLEGILFQRIVILLDGLFFLGFLFFTLPLMKLSRQVIFLTNRFIKLRPVGGDELMPKKIANM